jgi:hypothetical protein
MNFDQPFLYCSKIVLGYRYIVFNALEVELGMEILKTVETETHITILAPTYGVPPPPMLGAHDTLSLWLGLLACWQDSPNKMSFQKSLHCIIRRMLPWYFVFNHSSILYEETLH